MRWAKNPRRRLAQKQPNIEDHRPQLGPEPRLVANPMDDNQDEDAAEELIPEVITRKPPKYPGRAEMARHRITHVPYRSWCDICVGAEPWDCHIGTVILTLSPKSRGSPKSQWIGLSAGTKLETNSFRCWS